MFDLAKDLCEGLEDVRDYESTLQSIIKAVDDGWSIKELWKINDEDSTIVYDILSDYKD